MSDEGAPPPLYPVDARVADDQEFNRAWGILWLGVWVRGLLAIPHAIIVFVLGILLYFSLWISWIFILVNGQLPNALGSLYGMTFRWQLRWTSYVYLMASPYPPFSISEAYPTAVDMPTPQAMSRLWGIPIVGFTVRSIFLIPHYIVLLFLALALAIVYIIVWVPILVNGRQSTILRGLFESFYRWAFRVEAYQLFLTAHYPPFSLSS